MTQNHSLLLRFWLGFWRLVNGTRKLVLNLLFLIFFGFLLVYLFSVEETVQLRASTTLVLQPRGNIVEQFTGSPADRAEQPLISLKRSNADTRSSGRGVNARVGGSGRCAKCGVVAHGDHISERCVQGVLDLGGQRCIRCRIPRNHEAHALDASADSGRPSARGR